MRLLLTLNHSNLCRGEIVTKLDVVPMQDWLRVILDNHVIINPLPVWLLYDEILVPVERHEISTVDGYVIQIP